VHKAKTKVKRKRDTIGRVTNTKNLIILQDALAAIRGKIVSAAAVPAAYLCTLSQVRAITTLGDAGFDSKAIAHSVGLSEEICAEVRNQIKWGTYLVYKAPEAAK